MRPYAASALVTAGAVAVVVLGPAAAAPTGSSPRAAEEGPGTRLLEQAADAGDRVSYRGTQFVVLWSEEGSTGALVEVLHRAGEGSLLRVAATPQGPGGPVFQPSSGGGEVPGVDGVERGAFNLLRRNYEAVVEGRATVAGRPVDVVSVRRPGASPTARFWLDRETHLALRREVYDSDGRTLRASAFVSFDLTPPRMPSTSNAAVMPAPTGERITVSRHDAMRAEGWVMPASLPDGLELYDVRLTGEGDDAVLHLSYSDGVSSISLFEQRGRLDPAAVEGWRRTTMEGAEVYEKPTFPRRIVWSGEGRVFTLVAECRQGTLAGVVRALPHGQDERGLLDRLGHGLSRVGSWFNPFG